MTREDTAVVAMLYAYCVSCRRSETQQKWTANDQRSHEKLKAALELYMDSDTLAQAVVQITTAQSLPDAR